MPKNSRKRKHTVGIEKMAPKNKFKPFDERTRAEEEKLSRILFGGASSFLQNLNNIDDDDTEPMSVGDSGIGEGDSDDNEEKRRPVWVDDDDDGIAVGDALDVQGRRLPNGGINDRRNEYSKLLKRKFQNIMGTQNWASMEKSEEVDSDDEVLRSCGFIKKPVVNSLPIGNLEYKKVKDLNCETYCEGPFINSIEFHPTSSVGMVAGSSGIATFFAVDGKRNEKLHSIEFQKFPILCSKLTSDGTEAIFGSRYSHLFSYDLIAAKATRRQLPHGMTHFKYFVMSPDSKYMAVAGRFGEVHIMLTATKERIALLKQDSTATSLCFNPEGNILYGHSNTGIVTVWDMNTHRVKHKWNDEGCLYGSVIDISPSNQFLATGSAQGVVNLYDVKEILQSKNPRPRKSVLNLTTNISCLKFNSSSELLGMASSDLENAVRLLHLESLNVFSNFPNFGTKLGHIHSLNISPNGGYLALGNKKSTVSLYRLKHFKNY